MRCLLCSAIFNSNEELIENYVSYHRVDANNRFFQKLFQQSNHMPILRQCLKFLKTVRSKFKPTALKFTHATFATEKT